MSSNEFALKFLRFVVDTGDRISDEVFLKAINSRVNETYFKDYCPHTKSFGDNAQSLLYSVAQSYYQAYRKRVTEDAAIAFLRSKSFDSFAISGVSSLIRDMKRLQVSDSDLGFVSDALSDNYTKLKATDIALRTVDLARSDPKKALNLAQESFTLLSVEAFSADAKHSGPIALEELIDTKLAEFRSDDTFTSPMAEFGFMSMDCALGGLFSGELTLFAAPPATGKSFFAQEVFFHNAILKGLNCVYATNEITVDQFWVRLVARFTGIPINKFISNALTPEDKHLVEISLESLRDKLDRNALILGPSDCYSPAVLQRNIDAFFGNKQVNLIVVDHLNNFQRSVKLSSASDNIAESAQELKRMASFYNAPVLSPTHMNRGANNNPNAGIYNVQYQVLIQIADTIFVITQDSDNPILPPEPGKFAGVPGIIRCSIGRARTAPTGMQFSFKAEFSTASITEHDVTHSGETGLSGSGVYGDVI